MKLKSNQAIGVFFMQEPDYTLVTSNRTYKAGEYLQSDTKRFGKQTVKVIGFRENSAIVEMVDGYKTVINYRHLGIRERVVPKETVIKKRTHNVNTQYIRKFFFDRQKTMASASVEIGFSRGWFARVVSTGHASQNGVDKMISVLGMDEQKLLNISKDHELQPNIMIDKEAFKPFVRKKMSMRELSSRIGMGRAFITDVCRDGVVNKHVWRRITDELDVPFEKFVLGEETK